MTERFDYLPKDPERLRAIIVLSPRKLDTLNDNRDARIELLSNQQLFLLNSETKDKSLVVENIRKSGLLIDGNILVQNPYNLSNYKRLEDASLIFPTLKYEYFITICSLLGARKVIVEQMEMKNRQGKVLAKNDINASLGIIDASLTDMSVDGNIKAELSAWKNMKESLSIHSEFSGGEPNFDKVEKYLQEYNLLHDENIRQLIIQRQNKLKRTVKRLKVSEEYKGNLDFVAGLKTLQIFSLNSRLKAGIESQYEFTLTINIQF